MKLAVFLVICFSSLSIWAQVAPVAAATPAGAALISSVNTATSKVPSSVPVGIIALLSFIVTELAARGIPTSKPQSWFLLLEGLIGALVAFLQKVQSLLVNIGTAFNNTSSPSP